MRYRWPSWRPPEDFRLNPDSIQNKGLVFWFPFYHRQNRVAKGTAYDFGPYAKAGTFNGTLLGAAAPIASEFGYALDINNADGHMTVADHAMLENAAFTVTVWQKYIGGTGDNGIVGKWVTTGNNRSWDIATHWSVTDEFYLAFSKDGAGFYSGGNTTNADLTTGVLYHCAFVIVAGATSPRVYLNGREVSWTWTTGADIPNPLYNGTAPVDLGRWLNQQQHIYDFRYYNRALSAAEIQHQYDPDTRFDLCWVPHFQIVVPALPPAGGAPVTVDAPSAIGAEATTGATLGIGVAVSSGTACGIGDANAGTAAIGVALAGSPAGGDGRATGAALSVGIALTAGHAPGTGQTGAPALGIGVALTGASGEGANQANGAMLTIPGAVLLTGGAASGMGLAVLPSLGIGIALRSGVTHGANGAIDATAAIGIGIIAAPVDGTGGAVAAILVVGIVLTSAPISGTEYGQAAVITAPAPGGQVLLAAGHAAGTGAANAPAVWAFRDIFATTLVIRTTIKTVDVRTTIKTVDVR